jgi:uncharacterized protein
MKNAQQEEFKHFAMDLELLLRRTPKWRVACEGVLFHDGDFLDVVAWPEVFDHVGLAGLAGAEGKELDAV